MEKVTKTIEVENVTILVGRDRDAGCEEITVVHIIAKEFDECGAPKLDVLLNIDTIYECNHD